MLRPGERFGVSTGYITRYHCVSAVVHMRLQAFSFAVILTPWSKNFATCRMCHYTAYAVPSVLACCSLPRSGVVQVLVGIYCPLLGHRGWWASTVPYQGTGGGGHLLSSLPINLALHSQIRPTPLGPLPQAACWKSASMNPLDVRAGVPSRMPLHTAST